MKLTDNETNSLRRTTKRLEELRQFLDSHHPPDVDTPPETWFRYLADMKAIQGNFSNDLSFVSCLLAKEYLLRRFEMPMFDIASKPQSASGLDIDQRTIKGERIIGEIKTTTPHYVVKFGGAQIASLKKDFAKLHQHQAEHKFMFLTDDRAFSAVRQTFHPDLLRGVTLVCLTSENEHIGESRPG